MALSVTPNHNSIAEFTFMGTSTNDLKNKIVILELISHWRDEG